MRDPFSDRRPFGKFIKYYRYDFEGMSIEESIEFRRSHERVLKEEEEMKADSVKRLSKVEEDYEERTLECKKGLCIKTIILGSSMIVGAISYFAMSYLEN